MLVSAGQPLFAEDTWWHLSLGAAYAEQGPWLDGDPLLHTAAGAPAPAAWLFDGVLHGLERVVGFQGLRVVHVLIVVWILGLAWTLLRRASGSPGFASLATSLFVSLSAYRLFQLRPHLLTLLATLLLLRLLILPGGVPSWRIVAFAAGLFALWVNVHGGFVLGLVLLGAAAIGQALLAIPDPRQRPRATRLAAALGLAGLATLANPTGTDPHLLYFAAGSETPALGLVLDEWAPAALFQLPIARVPPSALSWATLWVLLLTTPLLGLLLLRVRRGEAALAAVAAVALLGMISAVRLSWLCIVPLLLVGRFLSAREPSPRRAWAIAFATLLLLPGFVLAGAWPMISRGVHRWTYSQPYAISKYDGHAVWFLRDAKLEGNLFNGYADGNFLGYWLAPRLRAFVNGSLNVPKPVMDARSAIEARSGDAQGSFLELLDRYRIDVFFGSGVPGVSPVRSEASTTAHLERAPGWLPVFRSPRSAVYLRTNPRNRENLERVVAHYRRERVPFDPEHGFDPGSVIRGASRWAAEHGIVPIDFRLLELAATSAAISRRVGPPERLAELYAALGLYELAGAKDRQRLRVDSTSLSAARRSVWSLLHLGRVEESLAAADRLEAVSPEGDLLSRLIASEARRFATLSDDDRAALLARVPLLRGPQVQRILVSLVAAEARPSRPR